MQILRAGVLYFALVFGAGFALGTIRTLWTAPSFGTRTAELMEMPIMLAVSGLSYNSANGDTGNPRGRLRLQFPSL